MSARVGMAALVLVGFVAAPASAASIGIDEILYAPGTNSALLSGTVNMEVLVSGTTLTIELSNTSSNDAGSGAGILLTGIGFQLPTGVQITGGQAFGAVDLDGDGLAEIIDVSSEWGYDNDPLNSGAFQNESFLDYNTVVSTLESMTTTKFAEGKVTNPVVLNGPDFGIVSSYESGSLGGNQAIRDSLTILLTLNTTFPTSEAASAFINSIKAGNVGVSFGSPHLSTVPEPGSLSLLGIGLTSLAALLRRTRKREGKNA
jgi:hypothetical protein